MAVGAVLTLITTQLKLVLFLTYFCQTPGQVFRLGIYLVLPLSQEEEEQEQEPFTKIYQRGVN